MFRERSEYLFSRVPVTSGGPWASGVFLDRKASGQLYSCRLESTSSRGGRGKKSSACEGSDALAKRKDSKHFRDRDAREAPAVCPRVSPGAKREMDALPVQSKNERLSSGSDSSEVNVNAIDFFDETAAQPQASSCPPLEDLAALQAALRLLHAGVAKSPFRSAPEASSAQGRLQKLSIRLGFGDELVLRRYDDSPCQTLVIAFCSLTEANDMQHEWVGTTRRAGVTHALFLTDPLRAWYLRSSASPVDPFAATLAVVTREVGNLQPSQVVCIGSSMGGYAATRCGLALGALSLPNLESVAVLAFGPQVFIDPSERVALSLPLMSFDRPLDRLAKIASAPKFGFPLQSLARLATHLATHGAHRLGLQTVRLELHVGEMATGDVREARLLHAAITLAVAESAGPAAPLPLPVGESQQRASSESQLACRVHVHAADDERSSHCIAASLQSRGGGYLEQLLRHTMFCAHI